MSVVDQEREKFEKWVAETTPELSIARSCLKEYIDARTVMAYLAWLGRATLQAIEMRQELEIRLKKIEEKA